MAPEVESIKNRFSLISPFPIQAQKFPQIRFMGSKYRLLPWIYETLNGFDFRTVLDAFAGSGAVSYLLKSTGKQVFANDTLNFAATISKAIIENKKYHLDDEALNRVLAYNPKQKHFIERTFSGIFFTPQDLRFLDRVSCNLQSISNPYEKALALAALIRSCVKRQPRGVFTVSGDLGHYNDGRRDLQISLQDHFREQITVYNKAVFDSGVDNFSCHGDVFNFPKQEIDLVYMDPPYVPRSDDNCYVKRYHFLEGLSCYWKGLEIMSDTKVRKIKKPFTPFSYRKTAIDAFNKLFCKFADSILVLSYSSNGYPDLETLVKLMRRYKKSVDILKRNHRYHFGTHKKVKRSQVQEYLILGY